MAAGGQINREETTGGWVSDKLGRRGGGGWLNSVSGGETGKDRIAIGTKAKCKGIRIETAI